MIKILIVDDLCSKRSKIVQAILDSSDISKQDIIEAKCVKDAKRFLYKLSFDLMILDLVLPIEDGCENSPKNGVSFLNEIGINPSINPPIHIVGISGHKDQIPEHDHDFKAKLWNLIEYEDSSSTLEDQLKNIIFHLVKIRKQFIAATFTNSSKAIIKHFEDNQLPNTIVGFNWSEVAHNIAVIVERTMDVPSRFSNASKAKNINLSNTKITSEYDFQNLIHLVLRPWLPSLESENIAVVFDGNTKNADFSVCSNCLIIEVKYIDSTGKKNDTLKTLEGLKSFYRQNANVRALLFLILVEESIEIDKYKIESEFSRTSTEPPVLVKVIVNKLK